MSNRLIDAMFRQKVADISKEIAENAEFYVRAFIAKTGLEPDNVVMIVEPLVEGGTRVWFEEAKDE